MFDVIAKESLNFAVVHGLRRLATPDRAAVALLRSDIMIRSRLLVLVLCVGVTACGGKSPTSPDEFPAVAGSYSGTTTIVFPELNQTVTCPTTTTVTQSGSSVNIAALQLSGECGTMSVPMGPGVIDDDGELQGQRTGTVTDTCGTYTFNGTAGFVGRELRVTIAFVSNTCWNMNLSIRLTRS